MRISDVLRGKGSSVATVEPATSVADLVASLAEAWARVSPLRAA